MRAICLSKYGSIDNLVQTELPTPQPQNRQVLVRVHASALGPADLKVALGKVKFLHGRRFPMVLGYDFSGVVESVGPGETQWQPGDCVFGFLPYGPANNQGAFAEFIVAQTDQIARKPDNVSHAQTAAAATSALTALQCIRDQGSLPATDASVLITGASGAVGSTAVLVAKRLGAQVTALGSPSGLELARRFGADAVIDRKNPNLVDNAVGSFNVIFDPAAAYRWSQWKAKLKHGGAFITTLPSAAFFADKLNSLFSPSSVALAYVKSKQKDLELLAGWLESGFEVAVDSTYPVRELAKAYAKYQKGDYLGRIVITVDDGFSTSK
ncbi:NAD(P)-dependent alcohol dehydrogenase [Duganella sp. BJB488]|uniref:NAD(P)-dependent alcohol dehydrogenase n=1 Tax=unclassified Duganella TaxID=2636909 RepID=UPI000E34730A|nr:MULTISPECIES: NAD(P)-dependent alcohol dehydrogenase [unclassified Duganella]RFP21862.1 NAD(P)-dependent alcohol dehydrogenase [Duganella sp. BJB489]RFP23655.1 NAD(P)-dependent alcohol dehydrogenase [Duganella sp. BJB488]RFP38821.1 NAD(P)-dependent alcohol dehydrogenase [Duganella sp. BJB480]